MTATTTKSEVLLKTALDELRMQMLGAQVLFGFQFNSGFQALSDRLSQTARIIDVVALYLIVAAIAVVIAVPCQHRLVEHGEASDRIYRTTTIYACIALLPLALALACDFFIVGDFMFSASFGWLSCFGMMFVSLSGWYGIAWILKPQTTGEHSAMGDRPTPLHAKIEQMLTEARVILPGAQAMLGFQFIVVLTEAFSKLPPSVQLVHFLALCAVTFAIILLITPAAIHRLTFAGADTVRFHKIGSALVTAALLPLALGIAFDLFVATFKLLGNPALALLSSSIAFFALILFWYLFPISIAVRQRRSQKQSRTS